MQKAELEKRRAEVKTRFDELVKQKTIITDELLRLQGSFTTLEDLITNYPKEGIERATKSRRSTKPLSDA